MTELRDHIELLEGGLFALYLVVELLPQEFELTFLYLLYFSGSHKWQVGGLHYLHVQVIDGHQDLAILTSGRHLGTRSLLIVGHDTVFLRLQLLKLLLLARNQIHLFHLIV